MHKYFSLRLFCILVTAIVVPVALFGFFIIRFVENDFNKEMRQKLMLFSIAKEGEIYKYLQELETRTMNFASEEFMVKNTTAIVQASSQSDLEAAQESLNEYLASKKEFDTQINDLFILDMRGGVIAATQPAMIGQDHARYKYFIKGTRGTFTMTPELYDPFYRETATPLVVTNPITDFNSKETVGLLVSNFTNQSLTDFFEKKVTAENPETISILLIDQYGKIFLDTRRNDTTPLPPTEDCTKQRNTDDSPSININTPEIMGIHMCLFDRGWTMIVATTQDEMSAPIHKLSLLIIVLLSVLVLVTFALVLLSVALSTKKQHTINQAKDMFLALTSHQLRTPLGAMRWNLEAMIAGEEGAISKNAKKILKEIYKNNIRLIDLVENLLEVSRITQGRKKFTFKKHNPLTIVRAAVRTIQPLAKEKKIEIAVRPINRIDSWILDEKYFHECIINLLSNAIKYNKIGGAIFVNLEITMSHLVITVADTGIGIPENEQPNILSKFYRASNAITSNTSGEGIGLFMVKLLIESWGGRLTFESIKNQGSTFTITLPRINTV